MIDLRAARRATRLTQLIAGGAAVAALAAPAPALAQDTGPVLGAGELVYTHSGGQYGAAWENDGRHNAPVLNAPGQTVTSLPTLDAAGYWMFHASGDAIVQSEFAGEFSVTHHPFGEGSGKTIHDVALASGAGTITFSTDEGLYRWNTSAGAPVQIDSNPVGKVDQSAEDVFGTTVYERRDALLPGIWIRRWKNVDGENVQVNERLIPGTTVGAESEPSISRDGSLVAWTSTRGGDGKKIRAKRLSGAPSNFEQQVNLAADGSFELGAQFTAVNEHPVVSPDGTEIAFSTDHNGPEGSSKRQIYSVNLPQMGYHQVFPTPREGIHGLAWQPSSAPYLDGGVSISGQIASSGTLTATPSGVKAGTARVFDEFRWERCAGATADTCTPIPYAQQATYTISQNDWGKRLRVTRYVENAFGKTQPVASELTNAVPLPDWSPPQKPTLGTPLPDAVTTATTAHFTWTGAEPGGTFECSLDDAAFAPCDPDDGFTVPAPIADGDHKFRVRQVDASLNQGPAAEHLWTVDATKPAKPVVTSGPAKTETARTATFVFNGEPFARFECSLDGGGWSACTSPATVANLATGLHKWSVRQVDQAGNVSTTTSASWTVEQAVTTPEPTPQAPAPAPVAAPAPAPAPAAQTTAAPAKPAAPARPRALTALVGGDAGGATSGGTASAATIKVEERAVGVGCQITGTVLTACHVDLYADVPRGTTARAASLVLVGTGSYEKTDGGKRLQVKVQLNATGRELLRKSPEGLKVTVKITGTPVAGPKLEASGVARLVPPRTTATVGGFAVDSAKLTAAAKRRLRTLARTVRSAERVRCVGNTDASSDSDTYLESLGLRRAKAVCAYLKARGVKAEYQRVSRGADAPRATNRTAAGRAANRRVELRIDR